MELKKSKVKAGDNLKEVSQICNCIGEIFAKYGLWNEAISEHSTELGLCEALEDHIGVAVACRKIGECHAALEEFEKALSFQERHLSIAKDCNDVVEEQRAWATIGKTWLDKAEISKHNQAITDALARAERAFQKSLEACERLKGKTAINNTEYHEMKARLLLNLGLVFDLRSDSVQSAQNMMRALSLAEKFHLVEDMYRCQFSLASLFKRTGEFSRALTYLNLSIKSAQKKIDKYLEGESLVQKSVVLVQMKEFASAKHCLKKVYKIGFRTPEEKDRVRKYFLSDLDGTSGMSLESISEASALEEMAEDLGNDSDNLLKKMKFYEKMGDLLAEDKSCKQAIENYLKMLNCAEKLKLPGTDLVPIYFSLAQTYTDNKQYQEAISYHHKELELQENQQACRTWMNIAEVQQLDCQSYSDVTQSCLNAIDCAKKCKDPKLQLQVLKMLLDVQDHYKKVTHKEQTNSKISNLKEKFELSSDESDAGDIQQSEDGDCSLSELTESDDSEEENSTVQSTQSHVRRGRAMKTKRNEKGETALHRACIEGNIKKVEKLISQGHPVNPRDHSGWLPIHEAANHDQVEILKLLLDHGAHMNDRGGEHCGGVTPLLDAASCGNLEVMQVLIDKGANMHARDNEGNSVLNSLRDWRERCPGKLEEEVKMKYKSMETYLQDKTEAHASRLSQICSSGRETVSEPPPCNSNRIGKKVKTKKRSLEKSLRRSVVDSDSNSDSEKSNQRKNNRSKNLSVHQPPKEQDPSEVFVNHHLHHQELPHSATHEYITALTCIGSSAKRAALSKHVTEVVREATDNPLITEDDYVADDWLIDDMQPSKKRRMDVDGLFSTNRTRKPPKQSPTSSEPQRKTTQPIKGPLICDDSSNSSTVSNSHDTQLPLSEELINLGDNLNESNSDEETVIFTHSSEMESSTSDILNRNRKVLNELSRKKKEKQLRITSFSSNVQKKVKSSSNLSDPIGEHQVSTSNPSTLLSIQTSGNPPERTGSSEPDSTVCMKVKVKVKDKLLLVPISKSDSGNTLSWLAQQVSQRYYSLCGLRPLLTLRTGDGAILSPEDVINMILSSNDEVEAEIYGWDLPPLSERYTQACKTMNATTYRNIKTLLHNCDNSGILKLSDLSLRSNQMQPILRALQCQNNLKELHIDGNRLGDAGMDNFTKSIDSLPNLSILNLSCSDITNIGLRSLADTLVKQCSGSSTDDINKPLQHLKTLNLSHNSLGDSCMLSLVDIIKNTPALVELAVKSCELTAKLFQEHRITLLEILKASQIQKIDVSYNSLGSLGTELLLKTINHLTITSLNLSATQTSPGISHLCLNLQNFLQKDGCRLTELNLSKCHIVKDDLDFISSIPVVGQHLQKLTLSQNPKLNSAVLESILKNSLSDKSSLETLSATNCALSSPLSTDFLDFLSDKLYSTVPLKEFVFTCDKIDKVDTDSLSRIWTDKWGSSGQFEFCGNKVNLFVKDNIVD